MNKQDYLKQFGKILMENGYYSPIKECKGYVYNQPRNNVVLDKFLSDFKSLITKATDVEKESIVLMVESILESSVFNILKIFDENKQFKLKYVIEGKEYDLQEIAEDNDYGNGFLFGEIFNWLEELKEK